ncbi:MAG: hypothetical protein LBG11_00855, partial [Bifidobacteriaceae bacterium]|nr:hypothetical protein [Bifidobacteriaceae bacterium]
MLQRARALLIALAVATSLVLSLPMVFVNQNARADGPKHLQVAASINQKTSAVVPHTDLIEYEVTVSCTEADCVEAKLTDRLPAELDGFLVESFRVSSNPSVEHTTHWSEGSTVLEAVPTTLGAATALELEFEDSLAGGGAGMPNGLFVTVLLRLRAPVSLTPASEIVGRPITFNPRATASNAADASSRAELTVTVAPALAAGLTKSWEPTAAAVGAPSTITLTAFNTSNTTVDSLTLSEPADPTAANPFEAVDFAGFGAESTLPGGAATVQVDAYVAGGWVTGTPSPSYAIPGAVNPTQVEGLRFTYAPAPDSALAIDTQEAAKAVVILNVVQRAVARSGSPSYTSTDTRVEVTNRASAQVAEDSAVSPTAVAEAKYTVVGSAPAIDIEKRMGAASPRADSSVIRGNDVIAAIKAQNLTPVSGVTKMAIADTLAGTGLSFVAWEEGELDFPDGASRATVTLTYTDGTSDEVQVMPRETAPNPTKAVRSFSITYISDTGSIKPNADVTVKVRLSTADVTGETASNTAVGQVYLGGTDPAAQDESTAQVALVSPQLDTTLAKSISPAITVAPGDSVITSLAARASGAPAATKIVITDA